MQWAQLVVQARLIRQTTLHLVHRRHRTGYIQQVSIGSDGRNRVLTEGSQPRGKLFFSCFHLEGRSSCGHATTACEFPCCFLGAGESSSGESLGARSGTSGASACLPLPFARFAGTSAGDVFLGTCTTLSPSAPMRRFATVADAGFCDFVAGRADACEDVPPFAGLDGCPGCWEGA